MQTMVEATHQKLPIKFNSATWGWMEVREVGEDADDEDGNDGDNY